MRVLVCYHDHAYTGKVDMIIVGTGSGGTVCGIGRKIKEVSPNCKVRNVGDFEKLTYFGFVKTVL